MAKWTDVLDGFYKPQDFEVVSAEWIATYAHTQAVAYNILKPIDVCSSLVNLIDSNRGYDRPYMINDKYFGLKKIRFLSEKQKSKLRKAKF